MGNNVVLSIFPGLDLLGRGFEEFGYCVVRGPDVIWGGDIHSFHPPINVFEGIIGGDPCQAHGNLAKLNARLGREPRFPDMTDEFARAIVEAQPDWWLRENIPPAPDITVPGYKVYKLRLNNRWLGEEQNRDRCFWFGTKDGRILDIEVALFESPNYEYAVTSCGASAVGLQFDRNNTNRSQKIVQRRKNAAHRLWERRCELMGVDPEFLKYAPFTQGGKNHALANGVSLYVARVVAKAVRKATLSMASTCGTHGKD